MNETDEDQARGAAALAQVLLPAETVPGVAANLRALAEHWRRVTDAAE